MSIALFAIIGATVNAGTAYWICFSGYSALKAISIVCQIFNKVKEEQ